jgi:hypothetical protein
MLSKKTTTEQPVSKTGILRNKKKKNEAYTEFSGFQDEIRVQAYYNYLKRMKDNTPGNEMTDWFDAENRVRLKMSTH